MKQSRALQAALFACGLAFTAASSAGGGASGAMLGNTCAGCHGTDGVSAGPAPTIAGMSAPYFTETMQAFRSAEIKSTIMTRIAKGYTDADLDAMAAHFAKKKFSRASQSADAGAAARGEKLHDKYCEKCHEDAGANAKDDSGFLAGQHKLYLQYTLSDFMDGSREPSKKMKKKLMSMHKKAGDKGLADLVEYYASQK
ncbi:MAG: c-type cytochrome [Gammaproteobacteria bacterium]|nr:c-type cytochrome [Gammaproteobacteria bacterium]